MDGVARTIQFANKTGRCPICRGRDRKPVSAEGTPGLRITCGSSDCVEMWVRPKSMRKYELRKME